MNFEMERVTGVGGYAVVDERGAEGDLVRKLYKVVRPDGEEGKVFLVLNKNTLEVRCDEKLAGLLTEQYESVMQSRYFGRGGIEVVDAGQLSGDEIDDLVRLSYNLTAEK